MKFSLLSAFLILAIGGAMGLLNHQRLLVSERDHKQLIDKAVELGISIDSEDVSARGMITKRQRELRAEKASALTSDLVAFAKDMAVRKNAGSAIEETDESQSLALMGRLLELDPAELKRVILGLRDDSSLPNDNQRSLVGFCIMMLADRQPQVALAVYLDTAELLGGDVVGQQVLSSSLSLWAKEDPRAACDWFRQNADKHPDILDEEAKKNIISGAAMKDPKLALQLIAEMDIQDSASAIGSLVDSAMTAEGRTAILSVLRDHVTTLTDTAERESILKDSLESMGRNLPDESFDKVKDWIVNSKLSQTEAGQFATGLSYFNTKEQTGQWIDWMGANLKESDARECADNLIGQWTQQDYLAAGQWLTAAPAGPAKEASVATYAETVAEYEPQVAVQWALTLPEGDLRRSTLESIYQNWPKTDAAAAAEFARKYGVDTSVER